MRASPAAGAQLVLDDLQHFRAAPFGCNNTFVFHIFLPVNRYYRHHQHDADEE